jgi:mRNA interferase RelE/StbE
MSFYKVKYSKSAEKFMKKNKTIGIKFFKAFTELAESKDNIHSYDVKKFYSKNYNDIFRLRIGDYRAIFRVIDNELIIYIFNIGARGDIYKKLNI